MSGCWASQGPGRWCYQSTALILQNGNHSIAGMSCLAQSVLMEFSLEVGVFVWVSGHSYFIPVCIVARQVRIVAVDSKLACCLPGMLHKLFQTLQSASVTAKHACKQAIPTHRCG